MTHRITRRLRCAALGLPAALALALPACSADGGGTGPDRDPPHEDPAPLPYLNSQQNMEAGVLLI